MAVPVALHLSGGQLCPCDTLSHSLWNNSYEHLACTKQACAQNAKAIKCRGPCPIPRCPFTFRNNFSHHCFNVISNHEKLLAIVLFKGIEKAINNIV